jgi:hypothetical protein
MAKFHPSAANDEIRTLCCTKQQAGLVYTRRCVYVKACAYYFIVERLFAIREDIDLLSSPTDHK